MQDAEKRKLEAERKEADAEKKRLAKESARRAELANKQMLMSKPQDLCENGSLQSAEIKDDQAKLPMAGDNPDLAKQLSVRSSGRDRNTVDYNRLASGTQGEPT